MTFLSNILSFHNYKYAYILLTITIIFEIAITLFVCTSTSLSIFAICLLAVALAIIFILVTMQNLSTGVIIFILIIPLLNMMLKKTVITIETIALTPVTFILWSIFIIFFISTVAMRSRSYQFFYLPIDIILILFIISASFSFLSSYYIGTSLDKSFIVFMTGIIEPVVFYFILRNIITKEKIVKGLLFSIVLAVGIGAILGLYYMLTSHGNLLQFVITRGGTRGFGFRNTNLYGIAAALVFPLTLLFTIHGDKRIMRFISALVGLSMIMAMSISFTRGVQIVILLEILMLFFFYKSSRKYLLPILMSLIVVVWILRDVILILLVRFITPEPTTMAITSISGRIEAWQLSLSTLCKYPLGLGGGNFNFVWQKFMPSLISRILPLGASHNIFLSIGTEFGILTMILFIASFFLQFKMCWWIFKHSKSVLYKDIAFIVGISYLGYCIYGVTTGCELSHVLNLAPIVTMNSFTIILFILFSIIACIFIEERKNSHV